MSLDAEILKSLKSSMGRATKHMGRSRKEVLDLLATIQGAGDDATQQGAHSVSLESKLLLLKQTCDEVDNLLLKFEQKAAAADDQTYDDDQSTWDDLLYDARKTVAEATIIHNRMNAQAVAPLPVAQNGQVAAAGPSGENAGLNDQLSRMITLLEQQQLNRSSQNGQQPDNRQNQFSRLPKQQLPTFDGDILKWKPFWQRFTSAVDENTAIGDVEKFNYLIGVLKKTPLELVQPLPLTAENYQTAKGLLVSKYGDERLVIALLYRRLNEMKPVRNEPASLQRFVADIDCLMGSLGSMGQNTSDDNFATIILSKLPSSVVIHLETDKPVSDPWTVSLVRAKLNDYLIRLDRTAKISAMAYAGGANAGRSYEFTGDSLYSGEKWQYGRKKGSGPVKKANDKGNGAFRGEKEPACLYCQGGHYSDQCRKFRTADERFKQLAGRCVVCLSDKHKKAECRSKKPCYHCKKEGNHHASLCFQKFGNVKPREASNYVADTDIQNHDEGDTHSDESSLLASGEGVSMQTAQVPVRIDKKGMVSYLMTRAVFDAGASRTYCTEKLARQLNLKLRPGPTLTVNHFGSEKPSLIPTRLAVIKLRKLDGAEFSIEVNVTNEITGRLVRMPVKSGNLQKLQSRVTFADKIPTKFESSAVDLLIGNDYYLDLITGEKIKVDDGLWLLGSEFGFILTGRSSMKNGNHAVSMCGFTAGVLDGLEDMVALPRNGDTQLQKPNREDFWSLETIGIKDDPKIEEDDLAIQSFRETVCQENGRYSVGLPWNEKAADLKDDYALSHGRLESLVKKLRSNSELFDQYNSVIKGQIENGVVEKVGHPKSLKGCHYIPHHAVVQPDRETTKVRVVYDGSAKTRRGSPSLNECLYRGPIILDDLAGLLLRFRTHRIGVIADLEKAFLQIGINPGDRDMLRFLWLKDPDKRTVNQNVEEYRFCRVVFGLNCSPSLLGQTVKYHLEKTGGRVAKQILQDLYVDNVITGVESVEEGERFYQRSKKIFSDASMNLRTWASNSTDLIGKIPKADQLSSSGGVKVMGYIWDRGSDTLSVCQTVKTKLTAKSKREFLSQLAAVFDPLGFFSPVTVTGKVLLQEITKNNAEWDEKLPDSLARGCEDQRKRLDEISQISVPRLIQCRGKCSLVAFSDASTTSFATVVYLRCESSSGVYTKLVMSKCRLNPIKKLTIPRMELMGVVIGVRALNFVAKQMNFPANDGLLFTDSSCVLEWLKSQTKHNLFVKNRVNEIAKSKWVAYRYVNTDHNPADWATRGKLAKDLNAFWWDGPSWLRLPKAEWPTWGFQEVVAKEAEPVSNPIHQVCMVTTETLVAPLTMDINRFSAHSKLMRVTAWCLRFIKACKGQRSKDRCLTAMELQEAQGIWEKSVQLQTYGGPVSKARPGQTVRHGNLWLFRDAEQFIRCKSRMENADMPWDQKHPKLLPPKHAYTKLLISRVHEENGHSSVPHTLSLLRLKYWVPRGRQVVKGIVRRCVKCMKAIGRPYSLPQMPELPADRVRPQIPFTSVGVDYFGPLKVKGESGTEKAWVALFTCLTTRAIHLELVNDLSATEFLMCFRRFIARRGKPKIMVSDNAPQFKTVAKTVQIAWADVLKDPNVMDFSAGQGITWKFYRGVRPLHGWCL